MTNKMLAVRNTGRSGQVEGMFRTFKELARRGLSTDPGAWMHSLEFGRIGFVFHFFCFFGQL